MTCRDRPRRCASGGLTLLCCVVAAALRAAPAAAEPVKAAEPAAAAVTIGGPFTLTDQNGRPFSDQNLKGRPFLVFFGFTHCPDVCPTALFEISQILRALGHDAERTRAVFITVDPERDTPAAIKDYLSSFDPHLIGLTGDAAATFTDAGRDGRGR